MEKKTGKLSQVAGAEEMITVNNSAEANSPADNQPIPVESPRMEARVNSIIHEWLTDMWLLTTGEELGAELLNNKKHNGRPLAIVCDGQMRLMESRVFALDALRAVGIEMS
ncbi:MAG: hypothetical protein JNJ50_04965 [Acidobacteria bacterium]|nr:hypothetical protein [Acidobacteriota bacterium]